MWVLIDWTYQKLKKNSFNSILASLGNRDNDI